MYVHVAQQHLPASREEVDEDMPFEFKTKSPSARAIVDATEITCQVPSSFILKSGTLSSYMSGNIFKELVGIYQQFTINTENKPWWSTFLIDWYALLRHHCVMPICTAQFKHRLKVTVIL